MTPIRDLVEDAPETSSLSIRALRAGHVRLGSFARGHPIESPTFVFTSADRLRLEPLARTLGGEIAEYQPQGAGEERWRLISQTDAFTALFPFADLEANVSQHWEKWGRSGIQRRCDGFDCSAIETDELTGERTETVVPCICETTDRRECAATTRVRLFLPTTGLVIWELVTHSKVGAVELYRQARFVAETSRGRMNLVPIRVLWSPRRIGYFDAEQGKRRTTTKRIVSLSIALDAGAALGALGLPEDQALISAVHTVLDRGLDRGLSDASPPRALGDGSAPRETVGAPLEGGADGDGEVGDVRAYGEGDASVADAEPEPTSVGAAERRGDEPPAVEERAVGGRAAEATEASADSSGAAPANDADSAPAAPTRPSPRDCSHPSWRPSATRPTLELCNVCGAGRKRADG